MLSSIEFPFPRLQWGKYLKLFGTLFQKTGREKTILIDEMIIHLLNNFLSGCLYFHLEKLFHFTLTQTGVAENINSLTPLFTKTLVNHLVNLC